MMEEKTLISNKTARKLADEIMPELAPLCKSCEIAGSVRRGKETVKDVELVALPKDREGLMARLDRLVIDKTITRALYGKVTRWGPKHRGFIYAGVRFEVFTADADNFGYIYWLRTGPDVGNQFVMRRMIYRNAPFSPQDGYFWVGKRKVSVPDEKEFFRLIGIDWVIPAGQRTDTHYKLLMHKWATTWTWADGDAPEAAPVQGLLF